MIVSIRELKAHLSRYLAEARAGREIRVTSHRKEIARITGVPETHHDGLARLVASGQAQWRGGKPAGAQIRISDQGRSLAEMVLRQRG